MNGFTKRGKLQFEDLTADNFARYQTALLKSEEAFPEILREGLDGIVRAMASKGYIGTLALLDGKYIGHAMSFEITPEKAQEMELEGMEIGASYGYNLVIDRPYRGKGFGTELSRTHLKAIKERGYKAIEGYANRNFSLNICQRLGARAVESEDNYCDSGVAYVQCRLEL